MLANSVKNQTKQIFQNIEILFVNIQENEFDTIKGGFKTWKHIYHLIHSLIQVIMKSQYFIKRI